VVESLLGTLFVLAANTLLRPVANRINRQPLTTPSVEVTCTVYLITAREHQKQALSLLRSLLEQLQHPLGDLAVHAFGEHEVEIEATLSATSIEQRARHPGDAPQRRGLCAAGVLEPEHHRVSPGGRPPGSPRAPTTGSSLWRAARIW
jgi:hypothetical protein